MGSWLARQFARRTSDGIGNIAVAQVAPVAGSEATDNRPATLAGRVMGVISPEVGSTRNAPGLGLSVVTQSEWPSDARLRMGAPTSIVRPGMPVLTGISTSAVPVLTQG